MPRVPLPYAGIERLTDLDVNIKTKIIVVALSQDRAESLTRDIIESFKNAGKPAIESG